MKLNLKSVVIIGMGLIIALSTILLVAFNFKQDDLTPAETILAYHEKAKAGEIEETKKYVADDILTAFKNKVYWHYGTYTNFVTDYANKTKSVKPLLDSETISGNNATIDVKIVFTNQRVETVKYYLVKERGKWKIAK